MTFAYRLTPWAAALLGAAVLSVLASPTAWAAERAERINLAQVDQATQLQLQTMQNSIRYLQVQMQQLTQIKEALTQAQQHDKEQAALIEQRLGKIDSALSGSRLLELVSQVETLNAELNKMRGELELMRNQFDKAEKRDKSLFTDFNDRLKKLEHGTSGSSGAVEDVAKSTSTATVDDTTTRVSAAASTSPSTAVAAGEPDVSAPASATIQVSPSAAGGASSSEANTPGSAAAATSATVLPSAASAASATTVTAAVTPNAKMLARDPVAENKLYDEALRQFRGGNYQAAVASFESFADKYPASALAPNAQYWIGVSYFNQRDFAKALQTNQALIKSYPDSAKVPDAMLNIASIYVEQNDYASARSTLEEVIAKHPASDAAAKARTRLTLLKK